MAIAKNLYRGLGSIDFAASARSVLQIALSPDDRDIRIVSHIKSSLARECEPLMFRINGDSSLEFLGMYDGGAFNGPGTSNDETKREIAKETTLQMLADGARPAKEVRSACLSAGVGDRTIDEAKGELKVKSNKVSNTEINFVTYISIQTVHATFMIKYRLKKGL